MRAVIYARYSTEHQREESIEGQIRECKEYAEKNGFTVINHYIDRALSAKTDKRPEFRKMIKDSAKGAFDVVIVWKLDRFARNRYDSARYKHALKKSGVRVVSAKENIAEDASGILLESVLDGMAEYYSVDLSEKVLRGMTENALKCKYNGGGVPIGYIVDKDNFFQLDPSAAPLIVDAFKMYAEGESIQKVTDMLNLKGLRTRNKRKLNSDNTTRMLKNRKYIGEYIFRDIAIPDGIPAIVTKEMFLLVEARFEKNKKAPARFKAEEQYILTTKLRCGECGAYMVGESGTGSNGKTYNYYKCANNKQKKGCHKKAVQKHWIEDIVVEQTVRILSDEALIQRIVDMVMELQKKENTALPLLKKQLAETEKAIGNMLNAIQQGIITDSTKQRLNELEDGKKLLEVDILREELEHPFLSAEQVRFWIDKFRLIDVTDHKQRQRLIDSFVNAVFVYDDRLVLTFNYKDSTQEITLKDLDVSDLGSQRAPE